MPSESQEQNCRPRVEDEFRKQLNSQWIREVACQNNCSSTETCSCQLKIVHVKAIEKWWSEQVTESPGQTRGHLFLDEMHSASHRTFPPAYQEIFTGEDCCIRILSLLLQQGHGDLIDLFHDGAMHDKYLIRGADHQILRKTLLEKMEREAVDTIVENFQRDKWAYCPMELTRGMAFNGHGTKVIPPFCYKTRLPDKGGTASVYWVAVQKDLISDHALACTLRDSLYVDDKYGECYQMILKSYSGNKKSVFDLEKSAFAGLNSKNDVPILQYLGSYTHDYGEGKDMGQTYNILLEYGDNDLYQAWADETNVPPVRAQEILQTWNSLFEIAKAIRHVHNLEVPRGGGSEPRRFHGWHADIKPDNILSIRGRLKLSDFGYSSFTPVIKEHSQSVPTEFIRGFTDTYGAPEVFRMKAADGTLSGVTQAIDIWSFGCVLSVAATWIVLGFQGIRQYEQLRQLAASNCQNGTTHDRFHNGQKALDEIRQWHDYLRGHLRPSDTTTEQVLTLIENHLLQPDPYKRPDSKKLCEDLQILHKRAQREIQDLPQHSRETDAAVLRALSKIEERAHSQRTLEAKTSSALLLQPMMPTGASQVNPRKWASMQLQKDDMINSKPLGQTPYRKEILRQELGESSPDLRGNGENANHNVHNGDFTQSPAHSTSMQEFQIPIPKRRPLKTPFRGVYQQERDMQYHEVHNQVGGQSVTPKTPTPQQRRNTSQDDDQQAWMTSSNPYSTRDSWNLGHAVESTLDGKFEGLPLASRQIAAKASLPQITTQPIPLSPPYTPGTKNPSYNTPLEQPSLEFQAQKDGNAQDSVPELPSPSSRYSVYRDKQVYSPANPAEPRPGITSTSNPLSLFESSKSPTEQESTQADYSDPYSRLEPAVEIRGSAVLHDSIKILQELPPSVLDLPYSICQKRRKLDQEKPGKIGRFKSMVTGREGRRMDPDLKDISSDRRELVFIIDNGRTMFGHWPVLTFVVETLAINAAGIDKSGIDLRFTVDWDHHDENDIVGDAGRRTLRRALTAASPECRQKGNVTTDMVTVFRKVYEEWEAKNKPATTLYFFTDGKWVEKNTEGISKYILAFAQQDRRLTGKRHFSIQLIRFGDDETDKKRLQWLDDELCSQHNLRDIIDHCSWRATVDKIFKGSIEGFHDENQDEELPIRYDYEKLVKKFDKFNKGEEVQQDGSRGQSAGFLSPSQPPSLYRSPSQLSGRSSASAPRRQDTAPPETPKSHSKRFSLSPFPL